LALGGREGREGRRRDAMRCDATELAASWEGGDFQSKGAGSYSCRVGVVGLDRSSGVAVGSWGGVGD